MTTYTVFSPRNGGSVMRLLIYKPNGYLDEDKVKVVLQEVRRGKPVAEHPVSEDHLTQAGADALVEKYREAGWQLQAEKEKPRRRDPRWNHHPGAVKTASRELPPLAPEEKKQPPEVVWAHT